MKHTVYVFMAGGKTNLRVDRGFSIRESIKWVRDYLGFPKKHVKISRYIDKFIILWIS